MWVLPPSLLSSERDARRAGEASARRVPTLLRAVPRRDQERAETRRQMCPGAAEQTSRRPADPGIRGRAANGAAVTDGCGRLLEHHETELGPNGASLCSYFKRTRTSATVRDRQPRASIVPGCADPFVPAASRRPPGLQLGRVGVPASCEPPRRQSLSRDPRQEQATRVERVRL